LDSDTFVRDDISEIFSVDADIACAPNHSKDYIGQQIWFGDTAILSLMGWSHRRDVYVNGGVIFYNSTLGATLFADNWHQKWLKWYAAAKSYRHRDQAALNAAIFDTAPRLEILPHRFNAQFKFTPSTVSNAVLLHFYAAWTGDETVTEVERLVGKLLKGAVLRQSHIETILRHKHPWRRDFWLDDLAAQRVIKKGFFDQEDSLWFQGRRMTSLGRRVLRRISRVR
jgi:hypothetical protein